MNNLIRKVLPFVFLAGISQCVLAQSVTNATNEEENQLESLLQQCNGCHGRAGASQSPDVPHLDGQEVSYLIDSMDLLRQKKRLSASAEHIPADWEIRQLRIIAKHYNAAKTEREQEETDPEKVELGREIFAERCEICHQNGGLETDDRGAGAPLLAGQRVRYIAAQIRAFKNGSRPFSFGIKQEFFLGKPVAIRGLVISEKKKKLADADADALAHFIASVRPVKVVSRGRSRTR